MEINLYRLPAYIAKNMIDKQIGNFTIIQLNGEFRDSVDISNPTIVIDVSSTANITAIGGTNPDRELNLFKRNPHLYVNYVRIPYLSRNYFVTKVTLLRKNILSIELHVDVVSTFKAFIYYQKAFVSRNKTNYHIELPDDRRIVTNESDVSIIELQDTLSSDKYVKFDCGFGTSPYFDIFNIFVCAYSTNINRNYIYNSSNHRATQPEGTNLPTPMINTFVIKEFHGYLLNKTLLAEVLSRTLVNTSIASAISSIYAYPFNFKNLPRYAPNWDNIAYQVDFKINDSLIGEYKVHDGDMTSEYLLNASFIIPNMINDFNDLEPYSIYELYIPYYGYYKLPYNSVRGHEIYLYYVVNYQTGSTTVIVYDNTDDFVLTSLNCQLGIEIPKNTSNTLEVKNRRDANNTSLSIGLLTSVLSVIGGLATGGAGGMLGVAGGLLAGGKTIGNYAINEKNNITNIGTVNFSGDLTPIFSEQNVFIRKTRRKIQYPLTTDFLEQNGGVLNELETLQNLEHTGYTEVADIPNIRFWGASSVDLNSHPIPTDTEINEIISVLKNGVIFN